VLDNEHGWMEIHPVSRIISEGKSSTTPENDTNPVVGYTRGGQAIHEGPRGGHYHYSKSGNKVYEKKN